MLTRMIGISLLALAPLAAPAADPEAPFPGSGYLFYGPGRAPGGGSLQQLGIGGEAFVYRGLALGAEGGYMFSSNYFDYGVGLVSLNPSYHFNRSRHARISPFVTGGYSLAFRGGITSLYNFGGGITWWIGDRFGLRLGVRDYVLPRSEHTPMFSLAFSFR